MVIIMNTPVLTLRPITEFNKTVSVGRVDAAGRVDVAAVLIPLEEDDGVIEDIVVQLWTWMIMTNQYLT